MCLHAGRKRVSRNIRAALRHEKGGAVYLSGPTKQNKTIYTFEHVIECFECECVLEKKHKAVD